MIIEPKTYLRNAYTSLQEPKNRDFAHKMKRFCKHTLCEMGSHNCQMPGQVAKLRAKRSFNIYIALCIVALFTELTK